MTHTLSAPARSAAAPRRVTRGLATGCLVAGPLFLGAGIVGGLTRDGFDFTRNAVSRRALGDLGWIRTTDFLLTAALLLAGSIGLRRELRGRAGVTWGPVLVGVFGVSSVAAAVFPADAGAGFPSGTPASASLSAHGALHMFSGTTRCLALRAAFFVLARPLTDPARDQSAAIR
ncbi:hypothetical protein GCM10010358_20590 [Streptomyces minutiscleroticus]|uniref:DUF998 domain-containing protein n=1 Tax=Streptomyces minutiscleroticus TaxID=68238 RepID=A0A918KJE0_9ACTN|nr:DUF998 domain-containing protein [Streptomyces minutiscleroticus]GGX66093.1 hypothetical protein GCM10010358_20590 [Streptomyces minutiscleroticus]